MIETTPNPLIQEKALILVPHMDDEILGCGHLLASLADPTNIHLLFATIGDSLPAGIQPNEHEASPAAIEKARKEESLAGLALFGIAPRQCSFMDIQDGTLRNHESLIFKKTNAVIQRESITQLIAPFEFDQHQDHLALNRVAKRIYLERKGIKLLEYFVYINYPLLPGKDIRTYCHPSTLTYVEPTSGKKRDALRLHVSQTTNYFKGQTRPVLTDDFCDQASSGREVYRDVDQAMTVKNPMKLPGTVIRVLQTLQPRLKRIKETLRQKLQK